MEIMESGKFNYESVDSAWRATCKVLFGREVGSLRGFEPYLKEAMLPWTVTKSSFSGKDVYLSNPHYKKGARFATPDEAKANKQKTFSINDIKDIDSLFRVASENMVYCGNKVFGKNLNIELVDNAIDCVDVYHAHNVRNVKKSAYISHVRESEHVFGIPAFPKIQFSIRCFEGINAQRMFESFYTNYSSDMYYSFNCSNCSDCMFGFNLRGKRHVIGNLQLPPDKYSILKRKLLSELAEGLEKKKRLFSICDFARMNDGIALQDVEPGEPIPTQPASAGVQRAFSETTKIVLGAEQRKIEDFAPYLMRHALPVWKVKGKFGSKTYRLDMPLVKDLPNCCLCTLQEALNNNRPYIAKSDAELPIRALAKKVSQKAAITLEMLEGSCRDIVDVSQAIDSTDIYCMWDCTTSTRSGCYTAVIQSQYIFGGYLRALDSEFCINLYDSTKVKRCFEVDSCSQSNSCYFCHNVEGCENCIFCCNVKGLHYAVFNKELPKEEYLRIKRMLLDYVNLELSKKKRLERSVFSLDKKMG